MTTINPNIPERLRIAEAFAITWKMILPFAISGVLALAGRTLSMN
jgi:NADH:ubiquinone oxidoreductase subunit H